MPPSRCRPSSPFSDGKLELVAAEFNGNAITWCVPVHSVPFPLHTPVCVCVCGRRTSKDRAKPDRLTVSYTPSAALPPHECSIIARFTSCKACARCPLERRIFDRSVTALSGSPHTVISLE